MMDIVETLARAGLGIVRRYLRRAAWMDLGPYYSPESTRVIPAGMTQPLVVTPGRDLLVTAVGWDVYDTAGANVVDAAVTNVSIGALSVYNLNAQGALPRMRRGVSPGGGVSIFSEMYTRGTRSYWPVQENGRIVFQADAVGAAFDRVFDVWVEGYSPSAENLLKRLAERGE